VSWAADSSNQSDVEQRLDASAKALTEVMSDPGNAIPEGVLRMAKCIAVVPSMMQVAVAIGANHGKGMVTCRTPYGWSGPVPMSITGGSWGAQIGGETIDLIMIVTNDQEMQRLLSSKVKFGTEASVAAGPVSRYAGVDADAKMNAEVLTYSKSRGAFAGTNLNGAALSQDEDDTRVLYGGDASFADILSGKIRVPPASQGFLSAVEKYAGQVRNPR